MASRSFPYPQRHGINSKFAYRSSLAYAYEKVLFSSQFLLGPQSQHFTVSDECARAQRNNHFYTVNGPAAYNYSHVATVDWPFYVDRSYCYYMPNTTFCGPSLCPP
jgi:hypothetical protein